MLFIKVYLDYTIFFVFPFVVRTYSNKSEGFLTRKQSTHGYPCEKHEFSKFNPQIARVIC
jgi:hypothetical protein